MATTTHALKPANDRPLAPILSAREHEVVVEVLQARLADLDRERERVERALNAVRAVSPN